MREIITAILVVCALAGCVQRPDNILPETPDGPNPHTELQCGEIIRRGISLEEELATTSEEQNNLANRVTYINGLGIILSPFFIAAWVVSLGDQSKKIASLKGEIEQIEEAKSARSC